MTDPENASEHDSRSVAEPDRKGRRGDDPASAASEGPPDGLTHFDAEGRAHMVDVGGKDETHRVAVAEGCIRMEAATLAMIEAGTHEKGDVLGIARVAGIMGAKRTSDLVPLCHPIGLTRVVVDFETARADDPTGGGSAAGGANPGADDQRAPSGDAPTGGNLVRCRVRAETRSRTGVEMEALIGLQVALATIYDMCKAVDRGMTMTDVRLLEKRGGKSGDWRA